MEYRYENEIVHLKHDLHHHPLDDQQDSLQQGVYENDDLTNENDQLYQKSLNYDQD